MGETIDLQRRRFLAGSLRRKRTTFRPPWLSETAIADCTGCGACVGACPNGLIGLTDGKPEISFAANACTFCGACARACPEELFDRDTRAFSHVATIGDRCLTYQGVVCEACRDACSEAAIRFVPRRGGPFHPDIRIADCTGCGACISACPTSAIGVAPVPELRNA